MQSSWSTKGQGDTAWGTQKTKPVFSVAHKDILKRNLDQGQPAEKKSYVPVRKPQPVSTHVTASDSESNAKEKTGRSWEPGDDETFIEFCRTFEKPFFDPSLFPSAVGKTQESHVERVRMMMFEMYAKSQPWLWSALMVKPKASTKQKDDADEYEYEYSYEDV